MCFAYRDKGECKYGSKCRYRHDKDKICKEQEPRATLNVFSVNLANDKSDASLMERARDGQSAGKVANDRDFSTLDSYNDYW